MNALRVLLSDRPFPNPSQGGGDLFLLMIKVLGVLDVLPRFRKEKGKLFVGRLKEAERAILPSVDDLDVLHSMAEPVTGLRNARASSR